jgi:hypothetical protein
MLKSKEEKEVQKWELLQEDMFLRETQIGCHNPKEAE